MVCSLREAQVFSYKGMFLQKAMKVVEVKYSEPTLFQPQGRSKNVFFFQDLILNKGGVQES